MASLAMPHGGDAGFAGVAVCFSGASVCAANQERESLVALYGGPVELEQIAAAAAAHGEVTGVLAAEAVSGQRSYLVAFGAGDTREWLILDAEAGVVDERVRVLEVASLVAMCELAAELAGLDDEPRVASPAYLDAVGTAELGAATGVVDAFVAEVEARYKLPLR